MERRIKRNKANKGIGKNRRKEMQGKKEAKEHGCLPIAKEKG